MFCVKVMLNGPYKNAGELIPRRVGVNEEVVVMDGRGIVIQMRLHRNEVPGRQPHRRACQPAPTGSAVQQEGCGQFGAGRIAGRRLYQVER